MSLLNLLQKAEALLCNSGPMITLLSGEVGLPPNFTGFSSCTSRGSPLNPCSLRILALAACFALTAFLYSPPEISRIGPVGRGNPTG